MINDDHYLSSLKESSRLYISSLLIVIAISVYLLDRAHKVYAGAMVPGGFTRQATVIGLDYSYFVLTLLFPIILGSVCMVCINLDEKIKRIRVRLSLQKDQIQDLLPYAIDEGTLPKYLNKLFNWLPIMGITIHTMAFSFYIYKLLNEGNGSPMSSEVYIGLDVILSIMMYPFSLLISLKLVWPFRNHL